MCTHLLYLYLHLAISLSTYQTVHIFIHILIYLFQPSVSSWRWQWWWGWLLWWQQCPNQNQATGGLATEATEDLGATEAMEACGAMEVLEVTVPVRSMDEEGTSELEVLVIWLRVDTEFRIYFSFSNSHHLYIPISHSSNLVSSTSWSNQSIFCCTTSNLGNKKFKFIYIFAYTKRRRKVIFSRIWMHNMLNIVG